MGGERPGAAGRRAGRSRRVRLRLRPRCARPGVPTPDRRATRGLRPAPPPRALPGRHCRDPRRAGRDRPLAIALRDPDAARRHRSGRRAGRSPRTDGMTADRDLDRIALAWLEQAPDELPDRVIDAVLLTAETTPQVRRPVLRGRWRSSHMTRFAILGTAAALGAALLGAVLLLGGGSRGDAGPTPVAVASSSPSASAIASAGEGALPASLSYRWISEERVLPILGVSSRTGLNFTS